MKNIFSTMILLGVLSLVSFGCVTGEYDLNVSESEASLNGGRKKECTDNRDIYFENVIGLGCNEYETVGRYVGTWEASIQGADSSKKYLVEITRHPEEYRINVKTDFGLSKDGGRRGFTKGLVSPVDIVLDVIGDKAELADYPDNVIKIDDIKIFEVNFFISEREKSKIVINAIEGDKYVGFADSAIKIDLVNKMQSHEILEIH